MGFRYVEPWIIPWTTAHAQWIQTGTGVASLGNGTLRLSTSASILQKRPYSRDYSYTDASIEFPITNIAGTAGTLRVCPLYTSTSVHLGAAITPTSISFLRNGTSSGTIQLSWSLGDTIKVYAHNSGTVRVSINGVVVLSGAPGAGPINTSPALETVGIAAGGSWDIGTIKIEPGTMPGVIGRRPLLGRFVIYLFSLGLGESDTQAMTRDDYWNPGGGTSTINTFLGNALDQYLAWCDNDARVLFRGTHGNHSQGVVPGRDIYGNNVVVNMFGPRHLDILAGKNGWTTDPTDARTNDDWQSALYDRRNSIAQLIPYGSPPPNGYGPTNIAASCTAWPQTPAAWNFYEQEYDNLALDPMYDSVTSMDPGGIAGARPAANDGGIGFFEHVSSKRSWIGVEPHCERFGAGKIGHLAYWGSKRTHMASITSRWETSIAQDKYFNRDNAPGREHLALIDYTSPITTGVAMYNYGMNVIDAGGTFVGDCSLLNETQVRSLYANGIRMAKAALDNGGPSRSRKHRR